MKKGNIYCGVIIICILTSSSCALSSTSYPEQIPPQLLYDTSKTAVDITLNVLETQATYTSSSATTTVSQVTTIATQTETIISVPTSSSEQQQIAESNSTSIAAPILPYGLINTTIEELESDDEMSDLLKYIPETFPYDMSIIEVLKGDSSKGHAELYITISNGISSFMYTIEDVPANFPSDELLSLLTYDSASGSALKERATQMGENSYMFHKVIANEKWISIWAHSLNGNVDPFCDAIAEMLNTLELK